MGTQDYIPEDAAANLSGVSPVTLNRFADAGYLNIEKSADGVPFFSRSQIESVFGLTLPESRPGFTSFDLTSHGSHEQKEDPPLVPEPPSWSEPRVAAVAVHPEQRQEDPPELPIEHVKEKPVQTVSLADKIEISRLSSIVSLQEKYIDLKEQELKSMREERDWLRARIERLEEKSDRDQLILVSISESNRNLIKVIEEKKSPLRSALEWIGLLPPPSNN